MLLAASALLALLAGPPAEPPAEPLPSVEVVVSPPRDPAGRPWIAQLLSEGDEGALEVEAEAPVRPDGTRRFERLDPELAYRVRIKSGDNEGWWMDEEPFLVAVDGKRAVSLGAVKVRGTVRFGRRLLRNATVVFGTEGAKVSVRLEADDHGAFEGVIPRDGTWMVTVAAESPRVSKNAELYVEPVSREGFSEVEVTITSHAVEGEMVEEDGSPLVKGFLNVYGKTLPNGLVQHWIPRDVPRPTPMDASSSR